VSAGAPAAPVVDEPDPYLPSNGDRTFSTLHYDLDLDYRVDDNHLTGRARIRLRADVPLSVVSLDLGSLRVQKVTVAGRRNIRFTRRGSKLRIRLASEVPVGTHLELDVRYAGKPRPMQGDWGDVGWEELDDGSIVAGQPNGAPSWFPCNDRPDDKASYTITVTTDSTYHVVANGVLGDRRHRGGRTTWCFEQAEPMATYLATVQIGRYRTSMLSHTKVRQVVAAPARLHRDVDIEFARQPEMMALFEDLFGPYPFDAYTVVVTDDDLEIPLEAQGLSVFGANHIDGSGTYQRLVAHELAHQWFGNSLTVARWRDVWLHEGFAAYSEWLWSEHSGGPSADRLARDHHRRLRALPQDLLITDPGPDLMFDDRLYKRGALTLHALRLHVGDAHFFAMLRSWVAFNRYGSVTTEDFVEHAMRSGHQPGVLALLSSWLWHRDLPSLPPPT
jgi:aminopeptidase